MLIQHRPETQAPMLDNVKDKGARDAFTAFFKLIYDMSNRLYADVRALERVERISALPTAAKDYRGKMYLLATAGEDTLHICVLNTGTGAYSWKQVTLS